MKGDATRELSCIELVELVTDYLEGALDPAERARFDEHLAACSGCATYLEQMRHTIALTGQLRAGDIPPTPPTAWSTPSAPGTSKETYPSEMYERVDAGCNYMCVTSHV